MSTRDEYWRRVWRDKRTKLDNAVSDGKVYTEIKGSRLFISCPVNNEFVRLAIGIGGRRLRRTNRWSFPAKYSAWILDKCREIYGANHIVVKGKL